MNTDQLEQQLTPTTERPTEVGWYVFLRSGSMTPEHLKVWRRERNDELMVELVPISNSCFLGTWTGPIDLSELLDVVREVKRLNRETLLLGLITEERDEAQAVIREIKDGDNPDLWGELVKQRDESSKEVKRLRVALTEAAEMTEHEQDRTLIYNHCKQAATAEKGAG